MDHKQAVITTRFVIEGSPIVSVFHDNDEGWQFFSKEAFEDEKDAKVVALSTIIDLQPGIEEILWLPAGMAASYNNETLHWDTWIQAEDE